MLDEKTYDAKLVEKIKAERVNSQLTLVDRNCLPRVIYFRPKVRRRYSLLLTLCLRLRLTLSFPLVLALASGFQILPSIFINPTPAFEASVKSSILPPLSSQFPNARTVHVENFPLEDRREFGRGGSRRVTRFLFRLSISLAFEGNCR